MVTATDCLYLVFTNFSFKTNKFIVSLYGSAEEWLHANRKEH